MIEFILSLKDQFSSKAKDVSNSLKGTYEGTKALEAAMKGLETQMLKASALGDTKNFNKLERQAHKMGEALAMSREKVGPLGMALGELKEHIGSMLVLDPVELFKGVGEGAMMAVEGVAKLAEGVVEFAHMAIEASEAKEKLLASFSALAGGEEAGAKTLGMIRELEKSVPQNQKTLGEWSQELLGAGVSLDDLQGNLKAVAGAQALVGGGDKVLNLLAKLNEAGQKGSKIKFSVASLAGTGVTEAEIMKKLGMTPKQLELAKKQGTLTGKNLADALVSVLAEKGAGPVAQQTLGLASQWDKLKDNVMRLFEDVDVKPFLEGLQSLFSVFDLGTESGKAMKGGITGALNFVFKFLADGIPKVRHFFLEMIIWGLKAYIGIKQHFTLVKAIAAAVLVGLITLGVAGVVALAPLIISFATLAIGVLAATWPILAIGAAVGLVAFAFVMWGDKIWDFIKGAGAAVADWVKGAENIATDFVMGLVHGIENGTKWVTDAVSNLGSKMLGGIKDVLGIHSPSIEMMKLGKMSGAGFAQGVTAANDNVASAAGGLSASAMSGAGAGGAAAPASGGGGTVVHVDSITIQVDGAKSPKETGAAVLTELSLAFETLALTQGLGSAA